MSLPGSKHPSSDIAKMPIKAVIDIKTEKSSSMKGRDHSNAGERLSLSSATQQKKKLATGQKRKRLIEHDVMAKICEHEHPNADSSVNAPTRTSTKIPIRYTMDGRTRKDTFPVKIMKMLTVKEFEKIIRWQDGGQSFTVLQPKLFAKQVLPKYFTKDAKYSTFKRKLKRWGFRQLGLKPEDTTTGGGGISDSPEIFCNELFQLGRFDLIDSMTCFGNTKCKPNKKTYFGNTKCKPNRNIPVASTALAAAALCELAAGQSSKTTGVSRLDMNKEKES